MLTDLFADLHWTEILNLIIALPICLGGFGATVVGVGYVLKEVLFKEIKRDIESAKDEVRARTAARHPRNISETPISLPPPTVDAGEEPPHAS
jgi:hypothetical protein